MNTIEIFAPRWRDRKILLGDWKIGVMNKVVVKDKRFPLPLYISGRDAMKFPVETKPTKSGSTANYRVIPIDSFRTVEE